MNWKKRIERAKKKGKFNATDRELAESWNTCAVGEHFAIVDENLRVLGPSGSFGGSLTRRDKIAGKGIDFSYAVDDDDFKWASELLKKIARFKPTL